MIGKRNHWMLVLSASAIFMITMGVRQSLGLFISPLNTATGLGIVTVSFALAMGQFAWGVAQPLFGALLDRAGTIRIIVVGALMMAVGLAATRTGRIEATPLFGGIVMLILGVAGVARLRQLPK